MKDNFSEKENRLNMARCPRFSSCSIPRCPLDYWMSERTELPGDQRCALLKLLGKSKSKRMERYLSPKMKGLVGFIPEKNKKCL